MDQSTQSVYDLWRAVIPDDGIPTIAQVDHRDDLTQEDLSDLFSGEKT